jgi:glyoxylase-like metal-dependent hydrolase (beta-lactamase superfamily II)
MRLAPGLHQIGSDVVNIYLVVDGAGVTIVDAGLPGHWRELDHELTQLGRSIHDVRGIVLTHGDSDHIGLAERLRQRNGIVVHVHELDAARARGQVSKPNSGWGPIKVRPLLSFLWYGARHGGLRTRPVREVVTFADGEELDLPGAPRIIHVPGHTPGSVAVHIAAVDALFVGDAMTTRSVLTGERGPRPAPFTLDPDTALASLAKLEAIPASWVLPGHGPPWRGGVAEAVRQVRQVAARR